MVHARGTPAHGTAAAPHPRRGTWHAGTHARGWVEHGDDGCLGVAPQARLQQAGELGVAVGDELLARLALRQPGEGRGRAQGAEVRGQTSQMTSTCGQPFKGMVTDWCGMAVQGCRSYVTQGAGKWWTARMRTVRTKIEHMAFARAPGHHCSEHEQRYVDGRALREARPRGARLGQPLAARQVHERDERRVQQVVRHGWGCGVGTRVRAERGAHTVPYGDAYARN